MSDEIPDYVYQTYVDDRRGESHRVAINPNWVVSVQEDERRPMDCGWQKVAIVSLSNGDKFVVYDYDRKVIKELWLDRKSLFTGAARQVLDHWREFGPENGFDETIETALTPFL